jgi:predicted PurR-regulated permease PerM
MKRLAFYTVIIAATLALLILLWQFRGVVILLVLSLVLTAALRPSVEFFVDRGLRPGLARVLVYLLVFGVLGLSLALIAGPLLAELQMLSNYLIVLYDSTYQEWLTASGLLQTIAAQLPAPDELGVTMTGPAGGAALRFLFGFTQSTATVLAGLVVVIVLSLYWSADRSHFERLWLSLLPANRRIQARRIWQATEEAMGSYVRSEFVQSFLAAVILAIGYRLIGLDYPILMGILAGLAWLIPLVGFVFAALASFLFGLASVGGLPVALGALALTTVVLAFLEFVVEPRLFRRNQFSGVLIIFLILVMVEAYGMVGFLLAPPLAVALQVLGSHVIRAMRRQPTTEIEFDTLEKRLAAVRARYDGQTAPDGLSTADGAATADGQPLPMPPEVASLHGRLAELIEGARRMTLEEL